MLPLLLVISVGFAITNAVTITSTNSWVSGQGEHAMEAWVHLPVATPLNNWFIKMTFTDRTYNFKNWEADVVCKDPDGLWYVVKNKNRRVYTGEIAFNFLISYYGQPVSGPGNEAVLVDANACNGGSGNPATTQRPGTQGPGTQAPTQQSSGNTGCVPSSGVYDYGDALMKSIKFYEAQRSGKLPSNNRIPWRGDSAMGDSGQNGEDLTGGWYDAGDLVKFGFPMAWSTTALAWGLIQWKNGYANSCQLDIMYDSLKWPLDYFLKCHVSTNKLYVQVGDGDADHASWNRPEDMTMARPGFYVDPSKPGSDVAGETAAAFAAGSIAFAGKDPAYSAKLLEHAKQLYSFAEAHKGKYSDSVPQAANFYKSWSGYEDELAWGAAWLHYATGDDTYLNKAKTYIGDGDASAFSWDDKTVGAQLLLYRFTKSDDYKHKVDTYLSNWRSGSGDISKTPKGLSFFQQWGPLRYAANSAFLALMAADYGLDASTNRNWAKGQLHYILGDAGHSYVVGFGKSPPQRPHHRPSSCHSGQPCSWNDYNSPGPNPHILYGALVGGPDKHDAYTDERSNYISNEVACDYNAGFQGALAALKELQVNGAIQ